MTTNNSQQSTVNSQQSTVNKPMTKTIVVKIGTSTLTRSTTGNLALSTIAALVEILADLRQQGHRVVLVSSGAVGVGCARLGLTERPRNIALKQAVAAVGQGRLMRVYDDLFTTLQQPIAQVLLTRGDLVQRNGYVNACNTFQQLLRLGVIPIVNENDTVAVDELKFGDNDTLSALVASLVEADWLFVLTDVEAAVFRRSAQQSRRAADRPSPKYGTANRISGANRRFPQWLGNRRYGDKNRSGENSNCIGSAHSHH
jgi:glutamate 5-kinase